jgi:mono/diheme cytochrome c family protein
MKVGTMHRVSSAVLLGLGLALFSFVSLRAQNPGGSAEGKKLKNPVVPSAASIAAGKDVYAKNCAACHGVDAKGDGRMAPKDSHPSNLTDAKWDRGATDGEIALVIQHGAGPDFKMRAFKGRLSDTDVWNVVNYLRSLGPPKK